MLWYVYSFNSLTGDFECIGAFSREDEARALFDQARADWDARNPEPRPRFSGVCAQQTWSEFREHVFQYELGRIVRPLVALVSGWPPYSGPHWREPPQTSSQ